MKDELQKLIDSKTVVTADWTGNFYYMLHKSDVVELVEKLYTFRKEEAPSESATASNISTRLCDKYSLTIDYAPILEEAYEDGLIEGKRQANERLFELFQNAQPK